MRPLWRYTLALPLLAVPFLELFSRFLSTRFFLGVHLTQTPSVILGVEHLVQLGFQFFSAFLDGSVIGELNTYVITGVHLDCQVIV